MTTGNFLDQHGSHHHHDAHHDETTKDLFGFWIYIMSDCILFAIIFATYGVLHNNTFGGISAAEVASIPFVLTETILLLVSSFTYGLAMIARNQQKVNQVLFWLMVTFILGFCFIAMELYEFNHLVQTGNSWQRSGFLSAFFTLVGTHGLHVTMGLIWMAVVMVQVKQNGINPMMTKRLTCLGLFWHFLDVVWIFVFSVVYLMGAIQ